MKSSQPSRRSRSPRRATPAGKGGFDASADEKRERELLILDGIEREQRRLAQALHDTICQSLTGIQLLAGVIASKIESGEVVDSAEVLELSELIGRTNGEVQGLVRWLRPAQLGKESLRFALADLARETSRRVTCELNWQAPDDFPEAKTAAQLFQIAQTAVNHALRRAGVQRIVISVAAQLPAFTLNVRDDGTGEGRVGNDSAERLFGWENLERRARAIDATLNVTASETGGMLVECRCGFPG